MKKTYIKPQATVVAIEDKSQTLCAGSPNTTYGTTGSSSWDNAFSSDPVNNTQGNSKRHSGGLWDDDEE